MLQAEETNVLAFVVCKIFLLYVLFKLKVKICLELLLFTLLVSVAVAE